MSQLPENIGQPEVVSGAKRFLIKGLWSAEEDRSLERLVSIHGPSNWSSIADRLGGRIGKQCRERWHNHLCPDIKKQAWSVEEDKAFIVAHKKYGNSWAEIAKQIPGRAENSIKNRWNTNRRKYLSGDSSQPQSLLLEYIGLCDRMGLLNRNLKGKAKSKSQKTTESQDVYIPLGVNESQDVYIPLAVNEDTHGEQLNVARDFNQSLVEDMEYSALLSGQENPNIDSAMAFGDGNADGLDFEKMILPSVNLGAWYGY